MTAFLRRLLRLEVSAMTHADYLYLLQVLQRIDLTLHRVEGKLDAGLKLEKAMSAELDRLEKSVADETDATTAIETAINGLVKQVKDLAAGGGTAAQFTAWADQLDALRARQIAAAALANTPAASGGGGAPAPGAAPKTRP
jgi:hypothetical protein